MPGFAFGPIRPNTRAGLPLTSRVLVPAVRRSLAVWVSGAAVVRGIDRKGIVPATATPDARIICRRVRSTGFLSLSPDVSMSVPVLELATNSIRWLSRIAVFFALLLEISDGGAEMAG